MSTTRRLRARACGSARVPPSANSKTGPTGHEVYAAPPGAAYNSWELSRPIDSRSAHAAELRPGPLDAAPVSFRLVVPGLPEHDSPRRAGVVGLDVDLGGRDAPELPSGLDGSAGVSENQSGTDAAALPRVPPAPRGRLSGIPLWPSLPWPEPDPELPFACDARRVIPRRIPGSPVPHVPPVREGGET